MRTNIRMMKKNNNFIIIDDDPSNNFICETVIKRMDPSASVLIFEDPEKAIVKILDMYSRSRTYLPTILFLDINMPVMNGWEFLDVFRNFTDILREQFVIYILSSSTEDFSDKKKKYPFISDFLSKPFTPKSLEKVLSETSENNFNSE